MPAARGQFLRFTLVGGTGYVVNLCVYWALLALGMHYLAAAAVSFLVAAVNNFLWNRTWTFAARGRRWLGQCLRALFVSSLSLGLNQIFLVALVAADAGRIEAQAVAILLATPFSFAANKLWAFAPGTGDEVGVRAPARA